MGTLGTGGIANSSGSVKVGIDSWISLVQGVGVVWSSSRRVASGSTVMVAVAVMTLLLGQRCSTMCTNSSKSTSNRFWLALEGVLTCLTSTEVTPLVLELTHADSRELSGSVVLGLILVYLVDWDGGVDN